MISTKIIFNSLLEMNILQIHGNIANIGGASQGTKILSEKYVKEKVLHFYATATKIAFYIPLTLVLIKSI